MHPNPACINPAVLVNTCMLTCLALCVRIRHTSRILAAAQHARFCVTYTAADKDHLSWPSFHKVLAIVCVTVGAPLLCTVGYFTWIKNMCGIQEKMGSLCAVPA